MTKYSSWVHYFRHNSWKPAQFPFSDSPTLSLEERGLLGASLQQFQLGEGSDGLGLLRRAGQFATTNQVPELGEAMVLFIREEQRHSAVLGLFLNQELIPQLQAHWVDGTFRTVRNLAGYELMLTVLVCAEFIAVPYYTAIHDATTSPVLRRIAQRILQDEAQHLEFQADNLALCAAKRGNFLRFITILAQIAALSAACLVVYSLHRRVFRAASMSPFRFWALAVEAHRPVLRKLSRNSQSEHRFAEAMLR